jgi:hypothetical protein
MKEPENSNFRRSKEWEQSKPCRGTDLRWMNVQWQVNRCVQPLTALEKLPRRMLIRAALSEMVMIIEVAGRYNGKQRSRLYERS